MERPNPLNTENLVKLFSNHDIGKSFIDAFYEHTKARSILHLTDFQNRSDDLGVPSIKIVAESKANYTYTVHIHAIKEEHLSNDYSRFWGELMLGGVLNARKYDPFKPIIHIIFAECEWIDNKAFETEYQLSNPGTSSYLTAKLMQVRVIELPKLGMKLERKRNADIVKDPILRWYAFLHPEIPKHVLRELMNADEMICKAQEILYSDD